MQQRGRKSATRLVQTTATVEPIPRAAPPADLSDYEAALWASVVATKPADWFQADTLPLLRSYCKHAATATLLDQELEKFDPKWLADDEGLKRFKSLTDMRDRESRALIALGRSMRLTQHAQYHTTAAATASRKAAKSKPWESK